MDLSESVRELVKRMHSDIIFCDSIFLLRQVDKHMLSNYGTIIVKMCEGKGEKEEK